MNVQEFVSSIYLGDRACKRITLDTWKSELAIEVDCISRVRSSDGQWHFYNDENIENGQIVFTDVRRLFNEQGYFPNDYINEFRASACEDGLYEFIFSADWVGDDGSRAEAKLTVIAGGICLRNPADPQTDIIT